VTEISRPLLAIVYGERSASVMALSEAASSLCDIVWIINSNQIAEKTVIRLLQRLGQVVDVAELSLDEAIEAVRICQPTGIVAYGDDQIELASILGGALELDYFDAAVAERLIDKVAQRQALAAAGLATPKFAAVPNSSSLDNIERLVDGVDFPVILKPRHGAASRETHLARDATQLWELVNAVATLDPGTELVIEEFMEGALPPPSSFFGDYVSVESVVSHGRISHLAVTGRLPSAKPFRETGLIIPTDFAPTLVAEILKVATAAIVAVGIQSGCLHTEIKVTDRGLRVIEVNGRIGGFVAPVMALAAPGINFFEISQKVALGEDVVVENVLSTNHVGYVIVAQPPIGVSRVVSVTGLDVLAKLPGVDSVTLSRRPGSAVDWRLGSHEYVYAVLGVAPDHGAVRGVQDFIDHNVVIEYD
jgi:hypothetical protein